MFCWKDVWFTVYCCYELASIRDRSIFNNFADLFVAVEWNKDIPYFSSIIESLTRDMNCYCIQSNSSNYGDSRVIAPRETVLKDIIKTKGGKNNCILVDDIDIKELRDYQRLEYYPNNHSPFKVTPPGFNKNIVEMKRKCTLFDYIKKHFSSKSDNK